MDEMSQTLANMLQQTSEDHHQAFKDTDRG